MRQKQDHAHSVIWAKLNQFTAWLYALIRASLFGRIMRGYSVVEGKIRDLFSRVFSKVRNENGSYLPASVQNFFATSLEKSFIIRFVHMIQMRVGRASVYSFGCFLFYSFVGTGFMGIIRAYIKTGTFIPSLDYLIMIGILLVTSMICLIPKRYTSGLTLGAAVKKSFLRFIQNGLGMQSDEGVTREGVATQELMLAFIFGLIFTVLCFFFSPVQALLLLVGLFLTVTIMQSPESGLVLVTFMTPLLFFTPVPTTLLIIMLVMTAVSFIVKVLSGRRRLRFRMIDALVLLWSIIQFCSGFSAFPGTDSWINGILCSFLLLGYFLTVNLMRDKLWLQRMYYALLVSTFLLAAISFLISFIPKRFIEIFDILSLDNAILNVRAVLDSPNIISMMLILLLPLSLLFLFRYRKRILSHAFVAVLEAMLIYSLIYSWTRSAWLGAIVAIIFMALLIDNRTLSVLILSIPGIVLAVILLINYGEGLFDHPVAKRFASIINFTDDSVRYRVEVWQSAARMAKDNILAGIGIGKEAFSAVFPSYAAVGTEGAEHAYMLPLQILVESGIGGLTVFIMSVFAMFQKTFEFISEEKDPFTRKNAIGGLCGILAFLVAGIFDYGWYNHQLYFVFWLVFGFVCANVRSGAEERESSVAHASKDPGAEDVLIHF
ncbi:MAG: O-antigen ligase family protein [Clostridia bacterium]|nr:O-antigen ligase family protein [Clostridia bacterium]